MKLPVISLRPSLIQALATGARSCSSSNMMAIRLVSTPVMRLVRSEKISVPLSLNWIEIDQPMPVESTTGSALSKSSPVSPISESVKSMQKRSEHVRSLNSNRAVCPIRDLASSMPLFTWNDSTGTPSCSANVLRISSLRLAPKVFVLIRKVRGPSWFKEVNGCSNRTRTVRRSSRSTGSLKVTRVIEPVAPGNWTIMRSSPMVWIIGSSVPKALTRRLMISSTPSI